MSQMLYLDWVADGEYIVAVFGFILLHASQVQPKNTSSVIIANLLSIAVGTIIYWAIGYAFAFGVIVGDKNSNFFLSYDRFFLIDATDRDYLTFSNDLQKLMLVLVLCNSGFISRMRYWVYPVLTIFISGIIYPLNVHWSQHPNGWLQNGVEVDQNGSPKNLSYSDIGGASRIYIFSGSISLIGTILLAPRMDRQGKNFKPVGGNLTPLMLVGYFLAFLGILYGQSGYFIRSETNGFLASGGAALVSFGLKRTGRFGDRSSTKALINGSLAGLIAVSMAPTGYLTYGAFVVGVIGGIAFTMWSALLQLCRIDDPTDSSAVHLGAGFWAAIAAPLLHTTGIVYDPSTYHVKLFGWHLLAAVTTFVWAGLTVFLVLILFVIARYIKYSGREAAELGLDQLEHKEPAYPDREQYSPDRSEQILDDLFLKDTGLYAYDTRASQDSGTLENQESGEQNPRSGDRFIEIV